MSALGRLVVGVLAAMSAADCATSRVERDIKRKYCQVLYDNLGMTRETWSEELRAQGEDARRALVRVARSDNPDEIRLCAMNYLVRFDDVRVAPVLRETISDPSETARLRQAAEEMRRAFYRGLAWPVVEQLFSSARDQDALTVVEALQHRREPQAAAMRVGLLADSRYREYLPQVLEAIAAQDGRGAAGAVAALLKDETRTDEISTRIAVTLATLAPIDHTADIQTAIASVDDSEARRRAVDQVVEELQAAQAAAADQQERSLLESTIRRLLASRPS